MADLNINDIVNDLIEGMTYRKIAEKYKVSLSTLHDAVARSEHFARAKMALELSAQTYEDQAEQILIDAPLDKWELQKARELSQLYRWKARVRNPKKYSEKIIQETEQPLEQTLTMPTFTDYLYEVSGDWVNERDFILPVVQEIEEFLLSNNKVLLLSMPQGAGKSFIANKLTEWLLGCSQLSLGTRSRSVMRICNTDSNVTKFQAAISNEISTPEWQKLFGVRKFANNNKNGMRFDGSWNDNAFFSSAKSSVMSRRADYLIFDDLYASMAEALSHSATDDYVMKFQTMWRGRLKGSSIGKIIMVGTRYAKNDFYQQVVDMYSDSSVVITVPAIGEDGNSFCEKTHPIDELLHDRATMNIDLFNAIYQQDPTAEGFINPFADWSPKFANVNESQFDYTCTVADPSFGVGGDFFVVGKFGYNRNGSAALLDILCERVCSDEMYIDFIERAGTKKNYIEKNGVGGMLMNRVINRTNAPIFPFTSIGNKLERIYMNANDIMNLTFNETIVAPFEQLTNLGKEQRDDFPDMLSHFFNNIKVYGY